MKKFILAIILSVTALVGINAQKAGYDPVKAPYGHGQDSVKCRMNLSLMSTAAKAENYKEAVKTWKSVYENCPASSRNIYIYGPRIFKSLYAEETDKAKKKEYFDLVMEMYDSRMKYFSNVDSKGTVLCFKAYDYQEMAGDDFDLTVSYDMLKEAIEDMKAELYPSDAFGHFMNASLRLYKEDESKKDQYISDYFRILDYMDEAKESYLANNDSDNAEYITALKSGIESAFVNSGAGDCNTLEGFYATKFDDNKDNEEFLNQAIASLSQTGCTKSDFYFKLSENLHRLNPSANSAIGLANRSLQNKDYDDALKYYEQAAELESDNKKSSDYMMTLAQVLSSQRKYSQARAAAYDALKFNPNNGNAYILIAQMYASSSEGVFSESEKRGLVFSAAVDKLLRAKSVDPNVASEANRLINQYSGYYMDKETAFMMGLDEGSAVQVPGWIGETTTVRTK
ncbi:MAG TPA: tetratricopeptide repeat protein [Dysgonamonadaceae bacterium]|nr:tetratricopeptide repeat protein [Dysgonamonadaceae bacterium]